MKYEKKIFHLLACLLPLWTPVQAQGQPSGEITVTGTVQNEYGEAFAGVVVRSEYERHETVSGEDGIFSLPVGDGSAYVSLWHEGYLAEKTPVRAEAVEVRLQRDIYRAGEIIHDGFGSRERWLTAGSTATVQGDELAKTPTAQLGPALAGRLPGLNTNENSSAWAQISTDLDIRGAHVGGTQQPLFIIDGFLLIHSPENAYEYITPDEIASVTVLKDASALALYGLKASRGAIVITTKKGRAGKLNVSLTMNGAMQEPTVVPFRASSSVYARLANEAAYNDNPASGQFQRFSQEQIDAFDAGTDREHYPSHDWYKEYFKQFAFMERMGLNFSGGSDRVHFFSNFNIMHQNTNFILDANRDKYDPTPHFFWANIRSNVDVTLNKYFKVFLNIAGNMKRENVPNSGMSAAYSTMLTGSQPTLYDLVTPEIIDPLTGEILQEGGKLLETPDHGDNLYGAFYRNGFSRYTNSNIYTNISVETDLSFLLTGLKLTGSMGYLANNVNRLYTGQSQEKWERTGSWDELIFQRKGTSEDSDLSYSKTASVYYHLNYKAQLAYARTFGKHHLGATAYWLFLDLTTGDPLRWKSVWSGVTATYDYDGRYVLTAASGYGGSDRFAPSNRFHPTPAVAAAWIVSNEAFLRRLSVIDLLKIRASYGWGGNDDNSMPRYPYMDKINATGGEETIGNPEYSPEMVKKTDYGFEIGIKGFRFAWDRFEYHTDNIVNGATSTIPGYYGNLGSLPRINASSFKNKGYEIEAGYAKNIGRNWTASIGGWLSHSENQWVTFTDETLRDDTYAFPKRYDGYAAGTAWGYLVDYTNGNGFFNSQRELAEYSKRISYSFSAPRVGDLKYRDLNNDGIIDEKDLAPLNDGGLPRFMYAFSGAVSYKNFDLSLLFQGRESERSSIAGAYGVNERANSNSVYARRHLKAWTAERYAAGEEIAHPALSNLSGNANNRASDFFMIDRSYLRLKNVEIGYTLPHNISSAVGLNKIRASLSGHNLFTWDRLENCDFGPESGDYNDIPVFRVFNIGLKVEF
ncbi:MAG: SusC/RagA family TonB-linked outer membrane protein [Bacteroidales bacterium]|jgi:TonB-linked SusC/RagA family outer membrane protein|nr:SusC/RagA family TonB-linked outer membrane protein [Bacteroidales bacterium]